MEPAYTKWERRTSDLITVQKTGAEIALELVKIARENYKKTPLAKRGISKADAIEMSLTLNTTMLQAIAEMD